MNGVERPVLSKLPTDSVGPEALCNLRVHRTAKLSETVDGILLSYLHHNAWTERHVLYHGGEFR